MNESILKLAPAGMWKEFQGILSVPRPSKKEAKMVKYLEQWAKDHDVKYVKEKCGNIIMTVPATKGMEDRKMIALQAHMDMVCEKNGDKVHDFENDPIEAVIKGEWLYANGTTLGADDGIGVAAALAIIAVAALLFLKSRSNASSPSMKRLASRVPRNLTRRTSLAASSSTSTPRTKVRSSSAAPAAWTPS